MKKRQRAQPRKKLDVEDDNNGDDENRTMIEIISVQDKPAHYETYPVANVAIWRIIMQNIWLPVGVPAEDANAEGSAICLSG
ncbi:hypothetical protein HK102_013330 [Quaeritorhiza haematococci]|nr:hypothetical protein HK102_013330 [Quaeritorhiza haematococci]